MSANSKRYETNYTLLFLVPTLLISQTNNSELLASTNEDGTAPDDSTILDVQYL